MAIYAPLPMRRRGRLALRLMSPLAALLIVWVVGFFWFVGRIPDHVVDATSPTDAIVVLTGAGGRLSVGLELLTQNRAKRLFVSGVYRGVDVATLLEASKQGPEGVGCCIEVGHSADNTIGNAAETAAWMMRNGYHSLRLVTSDYHMPRSLLEFREAMPEVTLVPHPVFHADIKTDRWWLYPGTAGLILREYTKYLFAWLNHVAAGAFSDQPLP
jgi:uncharacterized SAM-binding protein YcdF (DUF218 family)